MTTQFQKTIEHLLKSHNLFEAFLNQSSFHVRFDMKGLEWSHRLVTVARVQGKGECSRSSGSGVGSGVVRCGAVSVTREVWTAEKDSGDSGNA